MTLKEMDAKLDLGCVYKLNGKNIAAHKLRRFARSHGLEAPRIGKGYSISWALISLLTTCSSEKHEQ